MPTKKFPRFDLNESETYYKLLDENTSLQFLNSDSEPTIRKITNWLEARGYDKFWIIGRGTNHPYTNSVIVVQKPNASPNTNFDNTPKLGGKKSVLAPKKQARYGDSLKKK